MGPWEINKNNRYRYPYELLQSWSGEVLISETWNIKSNGKPGVKLQWVSIKYTVINKCEYCGKIGIKKFINYRRYPINAIACIRCSKMAVEITSCAILIQQTKGAINEQRKQIKNAN